MIQRIQSIWLLLAAAAAFLTLRFPFYTGEMPATDVIPPGYHTVTGQSSILLTILSAGVGLAALISIFLHKNRKMQFRIVMLTLLVSVVNLVLFYLETKNFVAGKGNFSLSAAFALSVPVFLILALRGIKKDDKLVKSLDRLR